MPPGIGSPGIYGMSLPVIFLFLGRGDRFQRLGSQGCQLEPILPWQPLARDFQGHENQDAGMLERSNCFAYSTLRQSTLRRYAPVARENAPAGIIGKIGKPRRHQFLGARKLCAPNELGNLEAHGAPYFSAFTRSRSSSS